MLKPKRRAAQRDWQNGRIGSFAERQGSRPNVRGGTDHRGCVYPEGRGYRERSRQRTLGGLQRIGFTLFGLLAISRRQPRKAIRSLQA